MYNQRGAIGLKLVFASRQLSAEHICGVSKMQDRQRQKETEIDREGERVREITLNCNLQILIRLFRHTSTIFYQF